MPAAHFRQTRPAQTGRPLLRRLWPDLLLGLAGALGLAPFGLWALTPLALAWPAILSNREVSAASVATISLPQARCPIPRSAQ